MDSDDPSQATTPSSSSSNDEEKSLAGEEEDSMVPVSERDLFLSTYRRQNFALPDSIMHYIAMNPTTHYVYQELIKTCKYFFIKNPIIIIFAAEWNGKKWEKLDKSKYYKTFHLTKCTSKIWIISQFTIYPENSLIELNPKLVSSLIPKFYRFGPKELVIAEQIFSYIEYAFLSSSVEHIRLVNVTVNDEHGAVIPLEKLVEIAVKAKGFYFLSDKALTNVTSATAKELFENPYFSRLEYFEIKHIPQTFDIEAFFEYMKKNKTTTKFRLTFDATISDAYKQRLDIIVDEILGTETLDYHPPRIHIYRRYVPKYDKLSTLHFRHCL